MDNVKSFERKACYYETDKMGVVHHSNYIRWFEEARVYYMTELGFPYDKMEKSGVMLPVLSVECKYIKPVRFDEKVSIDIRMTDLTNIRFAICYEVRNESGELMVTGKTTHAFVDLDMKVVRLKSRNPEMYEFFRSNVSEE